MELQTIKSLLSGNAAIGCLFARLEREIKFKVIHEELFQYHHKRKFSNKIYDELLPIAWHPSRVWDWCFDEDEKRVAEKLWS